MKTTICIFAAAAVILCGCIQKPDPKIAQLETRITVLESNLTDLQDRNAKVSGRAANTWMVVTNLNELREISDAEQAKMAAQISANAAELSALVNLFSNAIADDPRFKTPRTK